MVSDSVSEFLEDAGAGSFAAQAGASSPDPMQITVDPEIAKAKRRLQLLEELKALGPSGPTTVTPVPFESSTTAPTPQVEHVMPTVTHDGITHAIGPPTIMEPVPQEPVPVPRVTVPVPHPAEGTHVEFDLVAHPSQPIGQPEPEPDGATPAVLPDPRPEAPSPEVPAYVAPTDLCPEAQKLLRGVIARMSTVNWARVWKLKNAEAGWPATNGYPKGLWDRVQAQAKGILNERFIETWVRFLSANRSKVWATRPVATFIGTQAINLALIAEVEVAYGTRPGV